MLKVAFIDDGIMDEIEEAPKQTKKLSIRDGKILEKRRIPGAAFCLSHGTMCFWVFSEYIACKEYILYDIQILNEFTSRGSWHDLVNALQFCLDEEVDLINMSLGQTNFINDEANDLLKKLYNRGTIMIAAQNNNNQVTYPACSPYVLGVTRDYVDILKKDQFCYLDNINEKIDIISHCDFSDIEKKHNILMGKQTSFSAPFISAIIYNQMQKGRKREDIYRFLKESSSNIDEIRLWEYKVKSIPEWQEEIAAPVVCIEVNSSNLQKYFIEIVKSFRREEFHTVGIWISDEQIENLPYFFEYPIKKYTENDISRIVEWVFNITKADIIFIGYDCESIPECSDTIDLILTDRIQNGERILSTNGKNILQITEMVLSYFE